MRLIATNEWNSIRHVCAQNAAVVCRKLVFPKYVFIKPLHFLVQCYRYTPKWSTISPILNWPMTQPMNNVCARTKQQRWTYIICCHLNFPRCGFDLGKIIQTSNRNSTATVLVQVLGMWKCVILFRIFSLLFAASPMKRKHNGVIIAVVVFFPQLMSRTLHINN